MIRVDTRPRRSNAPRPAWKVATQFLQWLRGRPCACDGRNRNCGGRMVAAHGPDKASKGVGTKVADCQCIPLSWNCHELQHRIGWVSFAISYLGGKNPLDMADAYWTAWPGRIAWERANV